MNLFIGLIYCFVLQFADTVWKNVWSGDTASFFVENQLLRLDAEKTESSASISTKSDAIVSATWHLCGRMDFNPSSSNYLAVYLASSTDNAADSTLSGYYLLLGKSNDEIALWKSVDGAQKKLGASPKKRLNFNAVQYDILVQTDNVGNWTVRSKINEDGDYSVDFVVSDREINSASYFILNPHFSKTRTKHFAFDSISICSDFVESVTSYLARDAKKEDVILNEILFDVLTGGSEFVELYNMSDDWISAKSLAIATRKANGNLNYITPLSDDVNDALPPHTYIILSRNVENVCSEYDCGDGATVFSLPKMPAWNNSGASIVLLDRNDNVLDEFVYEPKMHSQFSYADKGRSLERIAFDSNEWVSASDECGGATPGKKNSASVSKDDGIVCSQNFITADYHDIVIAYSFPKPNYKGSLECFDRYGHEICTVMDYQMLDAEGEIRWSGEDDHGNALKAGIYILVFEAVSETGSRIRKKFVCTIGERFF